MTQLASFSVSTSTTAMRPSWHGVECPACKSESHTHTHTTHTHTTHTHHTHHTHTEKLDGLSRYSRDLQGTLWPRFRHILELNVASVRDTDPSKLGQIDTRPHYVISPSPPPTPSLSLSLSHSQITRRYAEFSAALVSINQSHPEEQVISCLVFNIQLSLSHTHTHTHTHTHYVRWKSVCWLYRLRLKM